MRAKTHLAASLAVFAAFAAAAICAQPAQTGLPKRPLPRPAWLRQEPLIIAGNWDSMPIFRRRAGGGTTWQEEDYAREHSEETVRKLKDLGVTMAVIHFYKGFGLAAEREHIDDARKLAALCRKYGLRVGVYIGSTVGYETFLAEKPEAREWFVQPFLGRPVVYGDQTFRKRVYFMHPGYREYIKRVLRLAIEDLKVDLIHFDNTSMQAQPPIFLHPLAVQDFRDFLTAKYTAEERKRRFGFSEVRYMEPPEVDRVRGVIGDPLWQEWADFRCHQLAAYYAEMESYIRGLNPQVAVECNPHSGISGRNTAWEQGVDYPRLLAHMDVVWTEEGNEAGVSSDGVLISKIRTYKMATSMDNRIFTYTGGARGAPLQMAESMTYNRQGLGMVGGVLAGYDLPETERRYIQFYRTHFADYRDVASVSDVAVLHSFASLAYNNDLPWQSTMLFEQALIQSRVPFDIVFDENLKDLSKYRVLALPDQESLSDAQLVLIRAFVQRGGGLVATEDSSLYTEWRLRRRDFGLAALFKVHAAPYSGGRAPRRGLDIPAVQNEAGKGRVVYIASIKPAVPRPPGAAMTSQYWKLPLNWQELIAAVRWAARDSLSLEVKAPPVVTAELLEQKPASRLLVHLINYGARQTPEIANVAVSLRLPAGRNVGRVTVLSPDDERQQNLDYALKDGRALFTVPRLKTYSVAIVDLK